MAGKRDKSEEIVLKLPQVEELMLERGVDISYERCCHVWTDLARSRG